MSESVRNQFPSLSRSTNEKPYIYLDGPAGTQVPQSVISRISQYYERSNANVGGYFKTSSETDQLMNDTRSKIAAFLNAEDKSCISLGQNMTTLNFSLSRAIERKLIPGDEIVITALDHEANRGPWLGLKTKGIIVKEVKLLPDGRLDYQHFQSLINPRTKLVALGWASNIFGTVNEVDLVRKWTRDNDCWLLLDAVHFAPHFNIDVQKADCDFLLCSAYKFYGPHVGILYSRPGLLDQLETDRLRTQKQKSPYRIETGTLNHAAIAGVNAATDFIASMGHGNTLRLQFENAYTNIHNHERKVFSLLYNGLSNLSGIQIIGPDLQDKMRAPTLSFTVEGKDPVAVCKALGENGIFAWDGHFYAIRATESLGLAEKGGVTRMGICIYNTELEVDRVLGVLKSIVIN